MKVKNKATVQTPYMVHGHLFSKILSPFYEGEIYKYRTTLQSHSENHNQSYKKRVRWARSINKKLMDLF